MGTRGRKPYTDKRIQRNIQIPTSLLKQLEEKLTDPGLGKKPHGAFSKYMEGLIRRDLQDKGDIVADRIRLVSDPFVPQNEIHVYDKEAPWLRAVLKVNL
jgi:hypothetical protein